MLIRDSELQRRIESFSDGQLLEIVTARRTEYRQIALDLAAKELMRRRVSFQFPSAGKSELTRPDEWTMDEVAALHELEVAKLPETPALGTILTSGHEQTWTRKDQLIILVGLYAVLALLAWSIYADNSAVMRWLEDGIYWVHIVLLIPVVLKICALLGKKLLDKV